MKSDEQLMEEYREGSEEAFGQLYDKYSRPVHRYILRRMRSSEADDLYQKVWRHLHEKRSHYKGQIFAPWLFVMVRNLLVDEYRSLGRRDLKRIQQELLELPADEARVPELEEVLSSLPADTAELVREYYLEGMSYEELEQKTGHSQANLRQRISRALKGLRKKII